MTDRIFVYANPHKQLVVYLRKELYILVSILLSMEKYFTEVLWEAFLLEPWGTES